MRLNQYPILFYSNLSAPKNLHSLSAIGHLYGIYTERNTSLPTLVTRWFDSKRYYENYPSPLNGSHSMVCTLNRFFNELI